MRADPAGNITLLVIDAVPPEQRAEIAAKLMLKASLGADQVGFVASPIFSPSAGRLEMMGGEFCGNAARAFGQYLAQQLGIKTGKLQIELSGCQHAIMVRVNADSQTANAEMPIPSGVFPLQLAGIDCVRVDFAGISHLVADCPQPKETLLYGADGMFGALGVDAYGVMFLNRQTGYMIPAVTVKATNSLVWEGSCGSGSVAAAVALTKDMADGHYSFLFEQPAGSIEATVIWQAGAVKQVSIGGSVRIENPMKIDI